MHAVNESMIIFGLVLHLESRNKETTKTNNCGQRQNKTIHDHGQKL